MAFTFKHGDRPLDGYTIQRGVGRGGFGEVYYAVSDGGKEVALKYLRDNPQIELRGVEHCMNLKSPHLVTVYDVRKNDAGEYFIVMEYISGPSLRDLLVAEPRGLGVQKAAFFLRELAKGLGYLHDRGIVHRDLKPGNIFYEDGYVKIGDYGLSKFISVSQHSVQTASVGTVHYMAPEVGSGNYGKGVDIYALGVMLYEMLLGRVPFEGSSMGEVLMKHLTAQPAIDELPAPFGAVIRRSLAKDPKDRYQSVDEMLEAVLGADEIRDSVGRFEPASISMAAARAVPQYAHAGVGGSSGRAGLPPTSPEPGAGSSRSEPWRQAAEDRDREWRERWSDRQERIHRKRDRVAGRLDEINDQLRSFERISPDSPPRFPPRSRWVAGLLGVFWPLGALGIHRFYMGYRRVGIAQIVLTLFTGGTAGLWGVVEGILILTGLWGRDVYGRPLVGGEGTPGRHWRWPMGLQRRWFSRLVYAALVAVALSAGVTVVHGGWNGGVHGVFSPDRFMETACTVLTFVIAMSAAAVLGAVLTGWLRAPAAPKVLGRVVVFGIGLAMLLIASVFCGEAFAPSRYYDSPQVVRMQQNNNGMQYIEYDGKSQRDSSMQLSQERRRRYDAMLEGLVGSLAVTMLLCNWVRRVRRGTEDHVDLGSAIWAGVIAAAAAKVFDCESAMLVAGGVAAAASLTVQAAACFRWPSPADGMSADLPIGDGSRPGEAVADAAPAAPPTSPNWRREVVDGVTSGVAEAVAGVGEELRAVPQWFGDDAPRRTSASAMTGEPWSPTVRPGYAKVGWGLLATALLATTLMCFVILGSIHMNQDEAAIAVGLAMACLGFQILPLSKLTRQRRYGFYRETMRPLAIAICAASMGGAVGPLTSTHMSNDETAVALGFIVVPLVFAFFFLLVRGSPPPSNTNYARPAGRAPENRDRLA